MTRLTIDREADAAYVYVADAAYVYVTEKPIARTRSLDENRLLDLDSDGEVRGIELLNISHGVELAGLPFPDEISDILRINGIREIRVAGRSILPE